jgi:hypothetical protein
MVALWIQKPLEFSSFPTVLLVATILRLALNISTTRLILSHGAQGPTSAGYRSFSASIPPERRRTSIPSMLCDTNERQMAEHSPKPRRGLSKVKPPMR